MGSAQLSKIDEHTALTSKAPTEREIKLTNGVTYVIASLKITNKKNFHVMASLRAAKLQTDCTISSNGKQHGRISMVISMTLVAE